MAQFCLPDQQIGRTRVLSQRAFSGDHQSYQFRVATSLANATKMFALSGAYSTYVKSSEDASSGTILAPVDSEENHQQLIIFFQDAKGCWGLLYTKGSYYLRVTAALLPHARGRCQTDETLWQNLLIASIIGQKQFTVHGLPAGYTKLQVAKALHSTIQWPVIPVYSSSANWTVRADVLPLHFQFKAGGVVISIAEVHSSKKAPEMAEAWKLMMALDTRNVFVQPIPQTPQPPLPAKPPANKRAAAELAKDSKTKTEQGMDVDAPPLQGKGPTPKKREREQEPSQTQSDSEPDPLMPSNRSASGCIQWLHQIPSIWSPTISTLRYSFQGRVKEIELRGSRLIIAMTECKPLQFLKTAFFLDCKLSTIQQEKCEIRTFVYPGICGEDLIDKVISAWQLPLDHEGFYRWDAHDKLGAVLLPAWRESGFADLFAGVGGFHEAVVAMEEKVEFAVELADFQASQYEFLHEAPVAKWDIMDSRLWPLIARTARWTAGPPCQPFS